MSRHLNGREIYSRGDKRWGTMSRMRAHFEKVTFDGASLLTFERVDQEFPMYWHYHPEFQLTLMVDSQGQRLVGDGISDYGPGDLVLLGPNLPHTWRTVPKRFPPNRRHRAVDLQFRADLFGGPFLNIDEMKPIVCLLQRSISGLAFGHTKTGQRVASKLIEFPSLSPAHRIVSILNILLDLAMEPEAKILSSERAMPSCRIEDQARVEVICNYLKEHSDQEIDFAAVAHLVHMDQASLCRFFKRATGSTMTSYVNRIRVGLAAKMLTETDLSALEIGFTVGFGNYSNFNRQFKQIKGHGPRVLRQQFLQKLTSPLPVDADNVGIAKKKISA